MRDSNINDRRRERIPIKQAKAPSAAAKLERFVTIDVNSRPDYLRCKRFDGEQAVGDIIAVARPPLLQQSRFDGFIVDGFSYDYDGPNFRIKNRLSDSKTEQQVIVPAYRNDVSSDNHQIIYAMRAETGLVESDDVGPIDDAHIIWMDVNLDARAWTAKA